MWRPFADPSNTPSPSSHFPYIPTPYFQSAASTTELDSIPTHNLTMSTLPAEMCPDVSDPSEISFWCMLIAVFEFVLFCVKFLVAWLIVLSCFGIAAFIIYGISRRLVTGKWPEFNEEDEGKIKSKSKSNCNCILEVQRGVRLLRQPRSRR